MEKIIKNLKSDIKKELEFLYFNLYNIKKIKNHPDIENFHHHNILKNYRNNIEFAFNILDEKKVSFRLQNFIIKKSDNDFNNK